MHLGEVKTQHHIGLATHGVLQGFGTDKWVTVAVATNPLPHAQKAVHIVLAHVLFQLGIELRNLAQKCGFVIAQRVFNFIRHGEFGIAQQARLPQLHHTGAQAVFIGFQFFGRDGIFARRRCCTVGIVGC